MCISRSLSISGALAPKAVLKPRGNRDSHSKPPGLLRVPVTSYADGGFAPGSSDPRERGKTGRGHLPGVCLRAKQAGDYPHLFGGANSWRGNGSTTRKLRVATVCQSATSPLDQDVVGSSPISHPSLPYRTTTLEAALGHDAARSWAGSRVAAGYDTMPLSATGARQPYIRES